MTTQTSIEDVFHNSDTIPIIDCDLLEAAKENIQPLASGRRVTALSAVLSTPHAQREGKHNSIKARHRINIEIALEDDEDEDSDPLEAYCRFVYWTLEAYPQGQSVESGLLELLEEATRVLKDHRDGKWRGEMRYLKLWVLYASYVEKPILVYAFLLANDIGTEHALLYEEYAAVLERDNRRTDADKIYTLGIARNVEPLDKLQNKHREFQKRMMAAPAAPLSTTITPASSAATTTKRTALGSSRTPHEDLFTVPSSSSSTSVPKSNGRLPIFVDPSGEEAPTDDSKTPYPDIGTRKTRIKENVPEARKAGGTTLKQAGKGKRVASASSSSKPKIAVFRDEVEADMPPPPIPTPVTNMKTPAKSKSGIAPFGDGSSASALPPVPSTPSTAFTPFRDEPDTPEAAAINVDAAPESVMKVKAAGKGPVLATSEAEALRKDPLKNHDI